MGAHYQDQNSGHLCFGGEHDEMLSFSEVKARLPELVAGVEEREEKVVVTKDGRPAAVLVNMQKYARLKETIDVLSDPALMDQIAESKAFYRTRKKGHQQRYGNGVHALRGGCAESSSNPRPHTSPHMFDVGRSTIPILTASGLVAR